jgi:hypothetical protein
LGIGCEGWSARLHAPPARPHVLHISDPHSGSAGDKAMTVMTLNVPRTRFALSRPIRPATTVDDGKATITPLLAVTTSALDETKDLER